MKSRLFSFVFLLFPLFADGYTMWYTPELDRPERVAFPALCSKHFYDNTGFTHNVWLEPCDSECIDQFKEYLKFIPLNFEPDCYGCRECKGVNFGEVIGEFALKLEDGTIKYIQTTNGTIRYAKEGIHVVPSNPKMFIK